MLFLHYYLVFTLGIHQSHSFLPLALRKLNVLRYTSMNTKYVNVTEKYDRPLHAFSRSPKPDLKHSGKPKARTLTPKVKYFKANRYVTGKLKSTRLGTDSNGRIALTYDDNTEKRRITLHKNLFEDVTDENIRILVTDDEIKVLPLIGFRSTTTRLDKSLYYVTRRPPKVITDIGDNDLDNDARETIGPITVLIEDDTNFEPKNGSKVIANKVSFFTKPSLIISAKEHNALGSNEVTKKTIRVIISDDIHFKPVGADVTRTSPSSRPTTPLLNTPLMVTDLQSDDLVTDPYGKIGPIRVIFKEDTHDYETDYTSVTKKPHDIAYFDITEGTVDYDNEYKSPDDFIGVTRRSTYYRLDLFTKTAEMSTVLKLNEIIDTAKAIRNNLDNLKAEYTNEDNYIEEENFTIIPKVKFTLMQYPMKQDSPTEVDPSQNNLKLTNNDITEESEEFLSRAVQMWKAKTRKTLKFPIISTLWPAVTENMYKFPFGPSQTSTSTQKDCGEESESNATVPYFLDKPSTWPPYTIRNYFGELLTTQKRGSARKSAQNSQADAYFTKNFNEVTMQINILTKHILSPRRRKMSTPRRTIPRKALRQRQTKKAWHCYECGMNDTKYGEDRCHKLFHQNTFISGREKNEFYLRRKYQKECDGNKEYFGQCFYRYLDIGTQYVERGCRDWPPSRGHTYASRLFQKLEYLLKKHRSGCVSSPNAILMPFSKNIQLYTYVHVCICEGRFCNDATTIVFDWSVILLSIILFMMVI